MFPKAEKKTRVDREIEALFAKLEELKPETEEYSAVMDRVIKLYKMRAETRPAQISPDTVVLAATNLIGIVLILGHERLFNNIITTKATSLALKPR